MPEYPVAARANLETGTVVIECLVDQNGRVHGATVVGSVTPALDAAALAAVNGWTFTPAVENGRVVPAVVRIPVDFVLTTRDIARARGTMLAGR